MTSVQELEVTVTSHIDVCAVRYEAIHARLKRLERLVISVGGTVILVLIGALGSMAVMLRGKHCTAFIRTHRNFDVITTAWFDFL